MRVIAAITSVIVFVTTFLPVSYASVLPYMPEPGQMIALTSKYELPRPVGLRVDSNDPLKLSFILDEGNYGLDKEALTREADMIGRYFLAALAMPEKDLWVNLSPYEQNRVAVDALAKTDLGKDMLGLDYVLKQLAASLTYPDSSQGKRYWDAMKNTPLAALGGRSAADSRGAQSAGVRPSFTKVWIVPGKIVVYESSDRAVVGELPLKAMVESDYLAHASQDSGNSKNSTNSINSFKANILPLIEKEINTGKNFAQLRQMYSTIVLANWYKNKLRATILGERYLDKNNVSGVSLADKQMREKIYAQYVEAFKRGAYNLTQVESRGVRLVKRAYFSGGLVAPASSDVTIDKSPAANARAQAIEERAPIAVLRAVSSAQGALKLYGSNDSYPLSDVEREKYIQQARTMISAVIDDMRSYPDRLDFYYKDNAAQYNGGAITQGQTDSVQSARERFVRQAAEYAKNIDTIAGQLVEMAATRGKVDSNDQELSNLSGPFLHLAAVENALAFAMRNPLDKLPVPIGAFRNELYNWVHANLSALEGNKLAQYADKARVTEAILAAADRKELLPSLGLANYEDKAYSLADSDGINRVSSYWAAVNILNGVYERMVEHYRLTGVSGIDEGLLSWLQRFITNTNSLLPHEQAVSVSRDIVAAVKVNHDAGKLLNGYCHIGLRPDGYDDTAMGEFIVRYLGDNLDDPALTNTRLNISDVGDSAVGGKIALAQQYGETTWYSPDFFYRTDESIRKDIAGIAVNRLFEDSSIAGMDELRNILANNYQMPEADAKRLIAKIYHNVRAIRRMVISQRDQNYQTAAALLQQASAAKKPGARPNSVSQELKDRLSAKTGIVREETIEDVTYYVYSDSDMEDNDAIFLQSIPNGHTSRYIIAVSEESFNEKDALDALATHEIEENRKLIMLNAWRDQEDSSAWGEITIRDRAHAFGQAKEILTWWSSHPGHLLPRHLRALQDRARGQELVDEWNNGWLRSHSSRWAQEGFMEQEQFVLRGYAALFNQQAVGGVKWDGISNNMRGIVSGGGVKFNEAALLKVIGNSDFSGLAPVVIDIIMPAR